MKKVIERCNKYINNIASLFNASHKIRGKFRLLFTPASQVPDSDGESIIDTYLVPEDTIARKSLQEEDDSRFLHLQILGSTIPEDFLSYEYLVQIDGEDPAGKNKVLSNVYDVEWNDRQISKTLFHILNDNKQVAAIS